VTVENRIMGKSMERRIADRLRNSGEGSDPNIHTKHGEGPTRVHHNIHHAGHYVQPGTAASPTSGKVDSTSESRGGKAPSGWDLKR
jgi:hypothetical protein